MRKQKSNKLYRSAGKWLFLWSPLRGRFCEGVPSNSLSLSLSQLTIYDSSFFTVTDLRSFHDLYDTNNCFRLDGRKLRDWFKSRSKRPRWLPADFVLIPVVTRYLPKSFKFLISFKSFQWALSLWIQCRASDVRIDNGAYRYWDKREAFYVSSWFTFIL